MPTQHPDEPRCDTCRFWHQIDMRRNFGDCYRYPPRTRWKEDAGLPNDIDHLRPKTSRWDWCGEHMVKGSSA